MRQLIWRLHRHQVFFAGCALLVLAVILLITGTTMANDYHSALSTCGVTRTCGEVSGALFQGDGLIIDVVSLSVVVPLLFGLFWGAPLVAKEFEEGTLDVAWTQSVTRRRWMTSNIAWAIVAAVLWGAAMTLLVTWWRRPEDALHGGRFSVVFDITGITPVAYSVFAVALGIAAGTLFRRVLPALATTLAGFVATRAAIGLWLRPRYLAPIRQSFPLVNDVSGAPPGAWALSKVVVNPGGKVFAPGSPGTPGLLPRCVLPRLGGQLPCGSRVPATRDVPAGQPVLDLPGHRDRYLPPPGRRTRGLGLPAGHPQGRLSLTTYCVATHCVVSWFGCKKTGRIPAAARTIPRP